jgi:hypothetical protein
MVAVAAEVTALVVTWKVAVVAPAATVTVAGTVAEALLLESVTVAAVAAAPVNVTVPAEAVPPITVVGFNATEETAGLMRTVRLAVAVWGVGVAESVTVTVNANVPNDVGVPLNTPAELRLMPGGVLPDHAQV